MATATCKTVAGATSAAYPFKLRASFCVTLAGCELATGRVAWAGSSARRKAINWLPTAQTPITLDGKTLNPVWYRALHELFEVRIGGIDAPTVPQVVVNQEQTQVQVLQAQDQAQSALVQANTVGNLVNVVRQVAMQSSLPGAQQIPVYMPVDTGTPASRQ